MPPASLWIYVMTENLNDLEQSDDDILSFEVSDAELEAAASATRGAAMSFPGAPTVSILVVCCSNE
jgi:hypothetical protein